MSRPRIPPAVQVSGFDLTPLLAALTTALSLWLVGDWIANPEESDAPTAMFLRLAAIFVSALTAGMLIYCWRRPRNSLRSLTLRDLVETGTYTLLVSFSVTALLYDHSQPETGESVFASAFAACLSLGCLYRLRVARPRQGFSTVTYIVTLNVVVTVLLLQAVLALSARYMPNPLLFDMTTAHGRIDAYRLKPEQKYGGYTANSLGFYDDEFFRRGPKDFVAAVVADSFGVGSVPRPYNFISVAEEIVRAGLGNDYDNVAIHNISVSSIGPREYHYLIETVALKYDPDLIVVALFVGNDVTEVDNLVDHRDWRVLQTWWLFRLAKRVVSVLEEQAIDPVEPREDVPRTDGTEQEQAPAQAVSREHPTFSPETFMVIERRRAAVSDPDDPNVARLYREMFETLMRIKDLVGDKLMLAIIPDEYQVNDELYARVLSGIPNSERYQRDYPQRLVRRFCEEQRMRCIDLLPPLRAAQSEASTYHLRDTHWNVFGNRVAGGALAEEILSWSEEN